MDDDIYYILSPASADDIYHILSPADDDIYYILSTAAAAADIYYILSPANRVTVKTSNKKLCSQLTNTTYATNSTLWKLYVCLCNWNYITIDVQFPWLFTLYSEEPHTNRDSCIVDTKMLGLIGSPLLVNFRCLVINSTQTSWYCLWG